jgi:hypothetical protein
LDKVYNCISRVVGLPQEGYFQKKFLLSNWNIKNIPEKVKNETFNETLTYLKSKTIDGKEERAFVKARTSDMG